MVLFGTLTDGESYSGGQKTGVSGWGARGATYDFRKKGRRVALAEAACMEGGHNVRKKGRRVTLAEAACMEGGHNV